MRPPYARLAPAALRALAARALGRREPLASHVLVTGRCTRRCAHCAIPGRRTREMSTGELLRCVKELAGAGCRKLTLTGGEPLAREDIGEVVRASRGSGAFTMLTTNGDLVPERLDDLAGLDVLSVSVDGPREAHDRLRGEGSFEAALAAVRAARRRGLRVWLSATLTRWSVGRASDLLRLARREGASLYVRPPIEYPLGGSAEAVPEPRRLRAAARELLLAKARGAPVVGSRSYLERLLSWPDRPPREGCLAGRLFCAVDVDGRVYPCLMALGREGAPSGLELGFGRAFDALAPFPCEGCWWECHAEASGLLSLRPGALADALGLG